MDHLTSLSKKILIQLFGWFLGPADMQMLWEEWLSCNESWTTSTWVIQLQQTNSFTRTGARRWMTIKQIAEKYGCMDTAKEIVKTKEQDKVLAATQIKPHPDCPTNEDSRLHF